MHGCCNASPMATFPAVGHCHCPLASAGWLRGSVVERRSSAGVLSLSFARPVADG